MFKQWQLVVLGMTFAMLFGLVGSYDYEDAQASQALYCDMTAEGSWPDYKSSPSYDKAMDCSYQVSLSQAQD